MLKVMTVQNMARYDVTRANLRFPPKRIVTFTIDDSTSKFKEVKACGSLKILQLEDYVEESYTPSFSPPVLKVEESVSKVVPPVVAPKVEEAVVVEETPVQAVELIELFSDNVYNPTPIADPTPYLDTTPVVIAPEEDIPDVTELEVAEEDEGAPKKFSCPYCDFNGIAQIGMYPHVKSKHPDKFEEYKIRVKNS